LRSAACSLCETIAARATGVRCEPEPPPEPPEEGDEPLVPAGEVVVEVVPEPDPPPEPPEPEPPPLPPPPSLEGGGGPLTSFWRVTLATLPPTSVTVNSTL